MSKLKGPKIELSQLKVPRVVRDVYQDLRDRRLLPLVALVLVAIVAVPFLLSGSSDENEAPLAPIAPEAAQTSSIEVVKATPGLREPDERLAGRSAKDPFQQHFVGSAVSPEPVTGGTTTTPVTGGEGDSGSSGGVAEPAPAPAPSDPSSGGGGPPADTGGDTGPPSGGGAKPGDLVFYTYAAKLTIVKIETTESGKKVVSEPEERDRVLPSTVLPSPKQQVATYMGISPKTGKPLLLVSTDVTEIFTDAKCASGTDTCQLLEVEPTFPVTFGYGENGVRYKINILKVEPVVTGHS